MSNLQSKQSSTKQSGPTNTTNNLITRVTNLFTSKSSSNPNPSTAQFPTNAQIENNLRKLYKSNNMGHFPREEAKRFLKDGYSVSDLSRVARDYNVGIIQSPLYKMPKLESFDLDTRNRITKDRYKLMENPSTKNLHMKEIDALLRIGLSESDLLKIARDRNKSMNSSIMAPINQRPQQVYSPTPSLPSEINNLLAYKEDNLELVIKNLMSVLEDLLLITFRCNK